MTYKSLREGERAFSTITFLSFTKKIDKKQPLIL